MEWLLISARALHFAAAISLAGVFGFRCLVADPAIRRSGLDPGIAERMNRRFRGLAWGSLALALVSGAAWLAATAATMSGQPLAAVLGSGMLTTVLTQTRFGEDWLLRLGLAAAVAVCLVIRPVPAWRWLALGLASAMLASLAWAGHGGATPGAPGTLHLSCDILHLLGAGFWLGTLVPLELLLAEAGRTESEPWLTTARIATRRFTALAVVSVSALVIGGLINTWFLAGTVPALLGTDYSRLLLAKIGLFLAMLLVASINLLRLTPRLGEAGAAVATIVQLRRNALIETALGLGVVGIVGVIGTMPPGLHSEPGWPLPFRLDLSALPFGATLAVALAAAACFGCLVAAVVALAAGRYYRAAALGTLFVLGAAAGWIPLRPAIERAYPTSFYASPEPFSAPSIARGATLYADNCAMCHGASGRGDGPAAASLSVRPADLTEEHLFGHTPGDLFWWISRGRDHGAMPGFAGVLKPDQRWDVINFVRARAAGIQSRKTAPQVTAAAAYPVPDFAFEAKGIQSTLQQMLQTGPVLLVLFDGPPLATRLQRLEIAHPDLAETHLHVVAVAIGGAKMDSEQPLSPDTVAVASTVRSALALYRSPADGNETRLMLDRNGGIRARWTAAAGNLPDAATLAAEAARAARFVVAEPNHAGHGH